MADNNEKEKDKKQVKYKFGKKELDLKTYIDTAGSKVQAFLNGQNWTDDQKQEFMNAYNQYMNGLQDQLNNDTNRFTTDDFGTIYDSQNILSNTDDDGIDPVGSEYYYDDKGNRITTDDYNTLKKRKQKRYKTFSANRFVAAYLNQIGQQLDPATKGQEKSKEKFDLNKHGFVADWARRNNPAGGESDLTPYLNMDKYDETSGKRGREERLKYLSDELQNYLNNFKDDYDFEGTPYKSSEEYKQKLKDLITKMQNGWSEEDMIAANQAGIGGNFYNTFFTEEKDPSLSEDQKKQKEQELKNKEEQEARNKWIDEQLALFDNNNYQYHKENQYNLGRLNSNYWSPETGWQGDAYRESFKEKDPYWKKYYNNGEFNHQQYFNDYLLNPFNSEGKRAIAGLIGMGYAKPIQEGDYQGMYYIPQYERDKRTNSGLVYDPINGRLFYSFIGDIPEEWNKIINNYKLSKGEINRRDKYSFKDGGSIELMQLGGGFDANTWMHEDRQKNLEERAKKSGRTVEQQEAGERKAGIYGIGVKDSAQNDNNGFSHTDYIRLGTIAADIVSMGAAFVPVYGTIASAAAGLGSSLGTLYADAFEDGLDWGDIGNYVTNVGLDVLGLIPGGGSAAKGVKIAKQLGKYATRAIATIGAMNTLSNGQQIIDSFKKLSSPTELTVDDWRNISAGLGLITGGTAAVTRKYKQAKMKAANAKPDNVAVELVSKDGAKKTVLFDKEDAKAIRKANDEGNIEGIKAVTSKYEDYKDWDISTNKTFGFRNVRSNGKWQSPLGNKSGKAKVFDVSQGYTIEGMQTGKIFANRGNWRNDVELTSANNPGKTVSQVDAEVQTYKDKLLKELQDAGTNFNNARKMARERAIQNHESLLQKQQDQTVKVTPKGYKTTSGKEGTGEGLNKTELKEYKYLQESENKRRQHLNNLREKLNSYKPPTGFNTSAYKQFKQKYVNTEGNVNIPVPNTNRVIQGTFEDIIKNLGIFKQGGTLDINKVRKFQEGKNIWRKNVYGGQDPNDTNTWDQYHNINDIYDKLKGMKSDDIINALNNLNSVSADFTEKRLNKTGFKDWNKAFNETGLNDFFGYNLEKSDYLGPTTWNRHSLIEKLKLNPIELSDGKIQFVNNQWQKIQNTQQPTATSDSLGSATQIGDLESEESGDKEKKKYNIFDSILPNVINNPTITYALPRAFYADKVNKNLTDLAIAGENTIFKNRPDLKSSLIGDYPAKKQGQENWAKLRSLANKSFTSDASLALAAKLDAENRGLEFFNQGNLQDNQAIRQSMEKAEQIANQNNLTRSEDAYFNALSSAQTRSNINKHLQAYEAKKHSNWDNLWKQFEFESRARIDENKQWQDYYAQKDIEDGVVDNLSELDPSLNSEAVQLYQKVQKGLMQPSEIPSDKWNLYVQAHNSAQKSIGNLMRFYRGIPKTLFVKEGTKLKIAKLKARQKDIENFQKSVEKSLDRNEKKLDRLSKSLYRLNKRK